MKDTTLDLTTCDKEQIHHIERVQGHGAFFALSRMDLKIKYASENASAFFNKEGSVSLFFNRRVSEIIPHDLYLSLQKRIRDYGTYSSPSYFSWGQEKHFNVYLYRIQDEIFGVEIEVNPHANIQDEKENLDGRYGDFLDKSKDAQSLEELCALACRAVRMISGMDRVMMYRFFPPTWYGEVIAEDKVANAHAFIHHRFPATDIPKPARDLYLRNQVRFIYDSHEPASDIQPQVDKLQRPLDLSDSKLRGVSHIHVEYLKNMGVRGSFSIAVKVEGKLWGLIACHSMEPVYISHAARAMCGIIAKNIALNGPLIEKVQEQSRELLFQKNLYGFFTELKLSENPQDDLFRNGRKVNELFNSHGFALVSSSKTDFLGVTPPTSSLKKLWSWVNHYFETENKSIFVTESLSSVQPEFETMKEEVSGFLALKISELDNAVLMIFRPELLKTIKWGGDPRKNLEARNYEGSINPRLSFETWKEVINKTSSRWHPHEVLGGQIFKSLIFDSIIKNQFFLDELEKKMGSKKT